MILDTTAPAEELQDKLSALEQLLLAYGRVAIGFSGGVDSSFFGRRMRPHHAYQYPPRPSHHAAHRHTRAGFV